MRIIKRFTLFCIVLFMALLLSFEDYTPQRDYTDLTKVRPVYPNIAIDMTKLKELGGTTYWYQTAGTGINNLFDDVLGTTVVSKGQWIHDTGTGGKISWSEDITLKHTNDLREVIIRENPGGTSLANNEVMFLDLVRDQEINAGSLDVEWVLFSWRTKASQSMTKMEWR